jgi:hypothetical protein
MNKKVGIIAIAIFLAVLFLATFGSFYTGYVVLDQKDISLQNYPYPFIKNNAQNALYLVEPISPTIEESSGIRRISDSIRPNTKNYRPTMRIYKPHQVPTESNFILIGNPCDNSLIAKELKISSCKSNLEKDQGLIKLINKERTSILIISGESDEGIRKAVKVLTNKNLYPLTGNQILVNGDYENPQLVYQN